MERKRSLDWTVAEGFVTDFCRKRFVETEDVHEGIRALQIMVPGIPDDMAEAVVRGCKKLVGTKELYLEDDDKVIEPYVWIKPRDIADCLCGWIAPDGRVFGHVDYNEASDHEDLARDIMRRKEVRYNGHSDYTSLEDAGFIKFSPDKALTDAFPGDVTEEQHQAIIRFMEGHKMQQLQLGASSLGILSLMDIRKMDLLQFGKMISIH